MRILITNDDGIGAAALTELASCLVTAGHDVVVAAPMEGYSGCGASIGKVAADHRVSVVRMKLSGAHDIAAHAVDGPPAFIVLAALQGIFGQRPDVIVSGPNSGFNLGPLVLHSGTLGAAVTAAANGVPGIALSTDKRARFGFESAAKFCARHLTGLVSAMGCGSALNINVPDLPLDRMAGIRLTNLSARSLVAIVVSDQEAVCGAAAERREMRISLAHDSDGSLHRQWRAANGERDDSDAQAIIDGCISVTVVHGGLRHLDGSGLDAVWRQAS